MDATDEVWSRVRAGEDLHEGLRATGLFPEDYLQIVAVAESSGSVPETLQRIAPDLEADARRSLSALAAALGWVVWALVAGVHRLDRVPVRAAVRGDPQRAGRGRPGRARGGGTVSGDAATDPFGFTLAAADGAARAGVWRTPHGR